MRLLIISPICPALLNSFSEVPLLPQMQRNFMLPLAVALWHWCFGNGVLATSNADRFILLTNSRCAVFSSPQIKIAVGIRRDLSTCGPKMSENLVQKEWDWYQNEWDISIIDVDWYSKYPWCFHYVSGCWHMYGVSNTLNWQCKFRVPTLYMYLWHHTHNIIMYQTFQEIQLSVQRS